MAVRTPVRTAASCPDATDLETQLKLARAQNAYLHRQLAQALASGPVPATTAATVQDLEAANAHLASRLAIVTLHWQDAQRREAQLKALLRLAHKDLGWTRWAPPVEGQTTLLSPAAMVEPLLRHLLTVAHPDKWQGQPAEVLAHELTVAIMALRAQLQEQASAPAL